MLLIFGHKWWQGGSRPPALADDPCTILILGGLTVKMGVWEGLPRPERGSDTLYCLLVVVHSPGSGALSRQWGTLPVVMHTPSIGALSRQCGTLPAVRHSPGSAALSRQWFTIAQQWCAGSCSFQVLMVACLLIVSDQSRTRGRSPGTDGPFIVDEAISLVHGLQPHPRFFYYYLCACVCCCLVLLTGQPLYDLPAWVATSLSYPGVTTHLS